MADGIYHTRLRQELNLNREDLGLNGAAYDIDQIWTEILTPVGDRDRDLLMCVARAQGEECKAETSGVKSPYMIVRKQRGSDGSLRYIAAHLPTAHDMTVEESDKHKALKGFIARTCDKAGLKYAVEKSTKSRTSRPDVTVEGNGGLDLGCEAQYYNAAGGNVRRRSRHHAESGLTANWITDDSTFHLIDRTNYIVTARYGWRQIDDAADLAAMNGARLLVEWHCSAAGSDGRPCPNGKITRAGIIGTSGCGKMHLQWEIPRLVDGGRDDYGLRKAALTVGRIIVDAATGGMESLFIPDRNDGRAGRYLWVPSADKKRWTESGGGSEDLPEDDDVLDDEVTFSDRDIEDVCRYGEEGFKPSAPLPRRGVSSIGLTMTIDIPEERAGTAGNSKPDNDHDTKPPEPVSRPKDDPRPAKCPGCGRSVSHRNMSGVQLHYPGCSARASKRAP